MACPACIDAVRPFLINPRPEVQRAAYAVVCAVPGEAGSKAVAEALPQAPPALRPMLIRVLGQRRYAPAVDSLIAAAKDSREPVAVAALDALRQIADPAALPTARMLAEQGRTASIKLAALKTCLAIGQPLVAQGKTELALSLYRQAYAIATRDAERVEALHGQAVQDQEDHDVETENRTQEDRSRARTAAHRVAARRHRARAGNHHRGESHHEGGGDCGNEGQNVHAGILLTRLPPRGRTGHNNPNGDGSSRGRQCPATRLSEVSIDLLGGKSQAGGGRAHAPDAGLADVGGGGAALVGFGARWLWESTPAAAAWLTAGAVAVGALKSRLVLDRVAGSIVTHIRARGDGRCLGGFLSLWI